MSAPEGTTPEQDRKVKKKSHLPIIVGTFVVLVFAGLIGGYLWVASSYSLVYLPGTFVNGLDMSGMTSREAAHELERLAEADHLDVYGRDESGENVLIGTVRSEDVNYSCLNTLELADEILKDQPTWLWPKYVWMGERLDHDVASAFSYDKSLLTETILNFATLQITNMESPRNAKISEFSTETGEYEIVPETKGNWVVRGELRKALNAGDYFGGGSRVLNLEDLGVYKSATVTADDAELQENLETVNLWASAMLTDNWVGTTVVVDGEQISKWIGFDENGTPVLNEELVAKFVKETAKENDNYGMKITFLTTSGEDKEITKSRYGWKTDRDETTAELVELVLAGEKKSCDPVYSEEGYGTPKYGVGDSYVEIDLGHQHLYLYSEGELVLESDFVSGNVAAGNTTPAGLYGVTYKTKDATLRGDTYESHVNYWMPFNGNIGMHDATWRSQFGGEIYLTSGSHGCINLPLSKAKKIYEYVAKHYPVVCYY
jgi:lipoprotein-anchoring transpeptidase ErfK/SrfK